MVNDCKQLVSVIIPTYNRKEWLVRAVESCFSQTHTNVEVLVIDDGSTDGTQMLLLEMEKRWGAGRFRWFFQKRQGACVARNLGMDEAKGQYLQFLDSDDVIDPVKFERQIRAMEETGRPVAVCDFLYINFLTGDVTKKVLNHDNLQLRLANFRSICISTALIRKRSIPANLRWNPSVKRNQDMDFMLRYFSSIRTWSYTPGFWSYYVCHGDSRISDSYCLGPQYVALFQSLLTYWGQSKQHILQQNTWMLREFALYMGRKVYAEKKYNEARKILYVALQWPYCRARIKMASSLLFKAIILECFLPLFMLFFVHLKKYTKWFHSDGK